MWGMKLCMGYEAVWGLELCVGYGAVRGVWSHVWGMRLRMWGVELLCGV
jgi:hypothetical protein